MRRTLFFAAGCMALSLTVGCVGLASAIAFEDGFEEAEDVRALLDHNSGRWTRVQISHDENVLFMHEDPTRSGRAALGFHAVPSDDVVSKALIERGGFRLYAGQSAMVDAWFLIPGGQSLDNVFLMDLECRDCWPAFSGRNNPSPGIRLTLKGDDGEVAVERAKIGHPKGTWRQPRHDPVLFPRDRWVRLTWILYLSPDDEGGTEVLIDGRPVLRARGATLPDISRFREKGVRLVEPLYYERLQIGITANGAENSVAMLVDDVTVSVAD